MKIILNVTGERNPGLAFKTLDPKLLADARQLAEQNLAHPRSEQVLNVPLLRCVQQLINEEPARFDMMDWQRPEPDMLPACGTVACIGGWAGLIAGVVYSASPSLFAQALGLNPGLEETPLFYVTSWPIEQREAFLEAERPVEIWRGCRARPERLDEEELAQIREARSIQARYASEIIDRVIIEGPENVWPETYGPGAGRRLDDDYDDV